MARTEAPGRGKRTRELLLASAATVLEREGIGALTTRSVATEAGVPLGTVHYWFTSKDELVAAVVDELLRDVRDRIVGTDAGGSLTDRLLSVHEQLASMPHLRQLSLYEITTHAIRSDDLGHVAADQYRDYRSAAVDSLTPWARSADEKLVGGAPALAALVVAVIDGLILADLAAPATPETASALQLFAQLLEQSSLAKSETDA